MKEIEIDMVISNCENETEQSICEKFVAWVESNGWLCGGGVKDITASGQEIER